MLWMHYFKGFCGTIRLCHAVPGAVSGTVEAHSIMESTRSLMRGATPGAAPCQTDSGCLLAGAPLCGAASAHQMLLCEQWA